MDSHSANIKKFIQQILRFHSLQSFFARDEFFVFKVINQVVGYRYFMPSNVVQVQEKRICGHPAIAG